MGEEIEVKTNQEVVNAAVQQEAAAGETAPAPKRKVRVGLIFLSIVPVVVLIYVQSMCQIPFLIAAGIEGYKNGFIKSMEDVGDGMDVIMSLFAEKYAFGAYVVYAVVGLIVFGLWYYKGFVKKNPKVSLKEVFGVKSVIAAILLVIGLYFVITAGFVIAYKLFPKTMENYVQLLQTSGLAVDSLIRIIYAIMLGPVLEELCLRGVVFGYLEKSGIKPCWIIFISGVLFGIMHLNIVQGVYAAFLGFFLGYLRYKYRSIYISSFAHILFNTTGTYGDEFMTKLELSDGVTLILGGVALFVLVFAILLITKDKKAFKQE